MILPSKLSISVSVIFCNRERFEGFAGGVSGGSAQAAGILAGGNPSR